MELGVCYYPEHWPQDMWTGDAQRMREMGISWVRIAEFAWCRIEPSPGKFDWPWLDRAVDTLYKAGLKVVLCTPTATPPKWLVDEMPGMLAVDARGQPRAFGARKHYCFSHGGYLQQAKRITQEVANRYGNHPAVAAWQTDNEYGCHDTTLSYSAAARAGFRAWLRVRYGEVSALNDAWGTVFWSAEYRHFDEIDLPNLTVTEANPAHRLDFQRYSSWAVAQFNQAQCSILRTHSPGRPISHNFMGFYTEFDHHQIAKDLDIATWDSYPLGFTQNFFLSPEEKAHYCHTGHPDIASFHHDLYRGMCTGAYADAPAHGRWWVMEQQPGPVNWAQWNPAPLDGMVRLWTWQAFAHGAEVVSYFRWRQVPFAQEQMHTGLHRPDNSLDQGGLEASQVGRELAQLATSLGTPYPIRNHAAMVFDYESLWMTQIQSQGKDYNPLELSFRIYSALRQLGLDVDIVSSYADLHAYALIVLPAQTHLHEGLLQRLKNTTAQIFCLPRSGSKTAHLSIPAGISPLEELAGIRVQRVASLPPGVQAGQLDLQGKHCAVTRWFEDIALAGASVEHALHDQRALVTRRANVRYVTGWLDDNTAWQALLGQAAQDAGLKTQTLPADVRISRTGNLWFVFNFSHQNVEWSPHEPAQQLMGEKIIAPCGVALWRIT